MNASRGYSLVELMVALTLGLILSAAATELFVASTVTSSFQRGMNEVQSSGRYALNLIIGDVRMAGLAQNNTKSPVPFPMVVADIEGLPVGSTKISSNATQLDALGGGNNSDQLVLQYVAQNTTTTDCEGTVVPKDATVINRYFLRNDVDTGTAALACDGGYRVGSTLTGYDNTDTGAVLVTGVQSFQVLYGVDDGIRTATCCAGANISGYVTATTYAAMAAPRPQILSIRIGLLVATQERTAGAAGTAPANSIWVLDRQLASTTAAFANGSLRRLFITTVAVRNADLDEV